MTRKVAVVIPCYKVKAQILEVLSEIPAFVEMIICVDDCCPQETACWIEENCTDPRVVVIQHSKNKGVGGAMVTGYRKALDLKADIVVKVDGDGQAQPELIAPLIEPLLHQRADYVKGNRFYDLESLRAMPSIRLFGNSILSFITKASSGYWNVMDPTNGFTAIDSRVLRRLPLDKLDERYFFESDMLFRLYTLRACVKDFPMTAKYEDEESSLSIAQTALSFPMKHLNRLGKRVLYTYFLRDFNVCSLQLIAGLLLFGFGFIFGGLRWYEGFATGTIQSTGTVMLSVLPIILGVQLLLSAVSYDVSSLPSEPVSPQLS